MLPEPVITPLLLQSPPAVQLVGLPDADFVHVIVADDPYEIFVAERDSVGVDGAGGGHVAVLQAAPPKSVAPIAVVGYTTGQVLPPFAGAVVIVKVRL